MNVTNQQLDAFHRFGAEQIAKSDTALSWDELFLRWDSHHQRDEINDAIAAGIADVDNGQFLPVDTVLKQIGEQFGFAE